MHTMSVSAELIKKKSRRIVEKNKDLNLGQIFCQTKVTVSNHLERRHYNEKVTVSLI